ncbi:MAG: hypothetical protein IKX42_11575 [Fibrobacter sp.]|nr:hypothetical protein [Fibrobacter sp.]
MKQKLVFGLSAAMVAGAFWACGSGEVIECDNESIDMLALTVSMDFNETDASLAIAKCLEDTLPGGCAQEMQTAPSFVVKSSETPKSSSSGGRSSAGKTSSSAFHMSSFGPIGTRSSSSAQPPMSSSTPVQSSSSIIVPAGQFGSCVPSKGTVELNEAVAWTFTWDTKGSGVGTMEVTTATYSWEMPEGSLATATTKTANTSYATSGPKTATITVSTSAHGSQTIPCAQQLNVNGAPITGCKCVTAAEKSVDYTATPDIAWAVSGCTSTVTPFTYEWDGVAGAEDTFIKTFTAATLSYAPTLRVSHQDNTIVTVTCPAIKVTKGPEFEITKQDTQVALPAGESNVVIDLPSGWHGQGDTGTCTLRCGDANAPVTITVGTETSRSDYSATLSIPVSKTVNKSSLVIGLNIAAKCQVGY